MTVEEAMLRRVALAFEVAPSELGIRPEVDPVAESMVRLRRQRRAELRSARKAPGDLAAMVAKLEALA